VDHQTNRSIGITARHVAGASRLPVPFVVPSLRDAEQVDILGDVVRGTRRGVDAARIDIAASVKVLNFLPAIGPIRGWRPVVFPGDAGTAVRLYGATSGYLEGQIVNPSIDLPQHDLRNAIIARIPTRGGDSGAAIVDRSNLVLGFLVGLGSDMPRDLRIFSPASSVLQVLGCDIPTNEGDE
jgi:hypothetical protein